MKINYEITYHKNGRIAIEQHIAESGFLYLHRLDGPAYINYYENGQRKSEFYIINNEHHRTDGPAIIDYSRKGKILREAYFLNNKQVNINQFIHAMRTAKNKTKTFKNMLNRNPTLKTELLTIIPNMFKNDLDQNVVNNLRLFI